jgi:hypothetical protein
MKAIMAPSLDKDRFEVISPKNFKTNRNYRHDLFVWKQAKAASQWAKHVKSYRRRPVLGKLIDWSIIA